MPFVSEKHYLEEPQKAFLYLITKLNITQKEAQRMIARGRLFVDGKPMVHTSAVISGAFEVVRFVPATQDNPPVFTHKDFAIFEKPSGVLVHPSNRHTPYSLVDEAKHHFGNDANITHRIDQETSGLLLISRNKESEVALKGAFERREIKKEYLALVKGEIKEPFMIDEPLDRHADKEAVVKIMMRVHPDGKSSQTYVEPLKYFKQYDATLIVAKPKTGRQHQIRVHLFHVKHPIIGDPLYNVPIEIASDFLDRKLTKEERFFYAGASRLLLHANRLYFSYEKNRFDIYSPTDFEKICLEELEKCPTKLTF